MFFKKHKLSFLNVSTQTHPLWHSKKGFETLVMDSSLNCGTSHQLDFETTQPITKMLVVLVSIWNGCQICIATTSRNENWWLSNLLKNTACCVQLLSNTHGQFPNLLAFLKFLDSGQPDGLGFHKEWQGSHPRAAAAANTVNEHRKRVNWVFNFTVTPFETIDS